MSQEIENLMAVIKSYARQKSLSFLEFVDYSNWSNIWKILFNIISTIVFLWGPVSWLISKLEFFNNKDYLSDYFTLKIFKTHIFI